MIWQDAVISAGGLISAVALVPTVLHKTQKPTLSTSVMTTFIIMAYVVVDYSLGLFLATAVSAVISLTWAVLAIQRFRLNRFINSVHPDLRRALEP